MSDQDIQNNEVERLRRAEARLLETEERYRVLADNVPVGLYRRTCGAEGRLVMVNPALVEMFAYSSAEDLHEMPMRDLYWNPDECELFSQRMFADGEVIKEELKMRKKDGSPIWVAVTTRMIYGENREPLYFDGIMEDITERILAAEEAALQQQRLIQADKMITLGILVSGVAHEINNPNQFIMSNLAPLQKTWKDAMPILDKYQQENGDFLLGGRKYAARRDQVENMFSSILKGSNRIKYIVDELRDYAREHPSDLNEQVNLNNVVKSALALLANLIKKSSDNFSVVYGDDLPLVNGDYQKLEQVMINLVQNACQSLEERSQPISVRTYYDSRRDLVAAEVSDGGSGIPEENMKHIKDPFFTTKREAGGTGLGLSISASIVEKHSGILQFDSEVGKGTAATLLLPAIKGEADGA